MIAPARKAALRDGLVKGRQNERPKTRRNRARQAAPQVVLKPCSIETPQRPIMPTEDLQSDATLDDFVKSAIAEIERREGYEQLLLQSLIFCKSGVMFK